MISWSQRRKIETVFVLLALAAGIGAFAWWVTKPAPSCNDGVQNGDETGVDCGGSCPRACPFEIAPLITFWSRVFSVEQGTYDAAAYLENVNPNLGVRDLRYLFRVYDADNVLVAERAGDTFVNPHERFVLFAPALSVGNRIPVRASLELDSPAWVKEATTTARASLTIQNPVFTNLPTPRLAADVQNASPFPVLHISLAAIVTDERENAVGVSMTQIDSIPAGGSQSAVFTWPAPFSGSSFRTEVIPRVPADGGAGQ